MALPAYAVLAFSGVCALWLASGTQRERPLLAVAAPESIRALEVNATAHPGVISMRGLAQAYLDARQPGLAVVLFEASLPDVRNDPRAKHVYARALLDEGRNAEALAAEEQVLKACSAPGNGPEARLPDGCDAVLLASAERRTAILAAMVAMGVEDTQAYPEMSLVAYQNATHETRVR